MAITVKVLINAQAFIRIINFHREGGGRLLEARVLTNNIQGVNKVRRHCSITYNFGINVHSILKLYRHTNLFNTKVRTILHLLQLYFI